MFHVVEEIRNHRGMQSGVTWLSSLLTLSGTKDLWSKLSPL